jgi:hypothetical protein
MKGLIETWLREKEAERIAVENRRFVEDRLLIEFGIDLSQEGSKTFNVEGFKVKTTSRHNRKVDGDKLQEIAREAGLSSHLGDLFKWQPSINAKQWNNADESIKQVLSEAITTKPGRTSFAIEQIEEK